MIEREGSDELWYSVRVKGSLEIKTDEESYVIGDVIPQFALFFFHLVSFCVLFFSKTGLGINFCC